MVAKNLSLALILLLLPLVTALDNDQVPDIAKQNSAYTIQVPCALNGWFCNSATLCNISIKSPAPLAPLVTNRAMVWSWAYMNYSLLVNQTSNLGRYEYNVKCTDPLTGLNDTTDRLLYITPNGKLLTEGENWILLGAVLLLLVLALVFLLMSLFLPAGPIKIFIFILGFLMLIGSLMIDINLLQNYVVSNEVLTKGMEYVFIALAIMGFAAFILLLVYTVVQIVTAMRNYRFNEG